jgi:hypothetical protein
MTIGQTKFEEDADWIELHLPDVTDEEIDRFVQSVAVKMECASEINARRATLQEILITRDLLCD